MKRLTRLRLMRIVVAAGACLLSVGVLDLVLRTKASAIPLGLQNYAFSLYDRLPGGLFVQEPITGVNFMWRSSETRAFWNGYQWIHRTDQRGFRNPSGLGKSTTLLLGDSLVYGHGVDAQDTVAHILREQFGHSVYDMSRQGACLYDHYVYLRLYLDEMAPERVVLFVFANDPSDLEVYRSRTLIDAVPEIEDYDYQAVRANIDTLAAHPPSKAVRLIFGAPSMRLLVRGLADITRPLRDLSFTREAEAATLEPFLDAGLAPRYYECIIGDLARRCRDRGISLELVHLHLWERQPNPADVETRRQIHEMLQTVATRHDLSYRTTDGLFAGCPECFLADDGHLAPEGHRRLAQFLDDLWNHDVRVGDGRLGMAGISDAEH